MSPEGTRACPDCGHRVTGAAKLCARCGYPLMFDAPEQAPEVQPEFLRKPVTEDRSDEADAWPVQPYSGPAMFVDEQAPGQHCPACGHRSHPRRVRCEVCAAELWPGSATPARTRTAVPPPATVRVRRRSWPRTAALIAVTVAAIGLVYLLAYALA